MKTKTILIVGFSVAFVLLVILSATALLIISDGVSKIETVVNENNTKTHLVNVMRNAARERTISLQKMLLMYDPFERDEEWLKLNRQGGIFAEARMKLMALPLSADEKTLLKTQGNMSNVIAPLQLEIAQLIMDDRTTVARRLLMQRAISGQDKVFEVLTMLVNLQDAAMKSAVSTVKEDYHWAVSIVLIFTFTVAALFVFIALYTIQNTRMVEKKLQREKERAQTTLYSIADGVITTDVNGIITDINEVAQNLSGWRAEDALGKSVRKVCLISGSRRRNQTPLYFDTVFIDKRSTHFAKNLWFQTKYGKRISIEGSVAPIFEHDHDVVGAVLVFRDVTSRIEAEQQLQAYKENLENLVEKRTRALKEANKNLESFSYSISHDLRAPLRGINGYSHALLEDYSDKLDDEGKQYLERIRIGSERIGTLMDDLLELSRVSSRTINKVRVNLSSMANEVVSMLDLKKADRHIEWVITDGLLDDADESLMWILLGNLFENAWKYTQNRQSARIEFSSLQRDDETIYYIRDNGIGFDMDHYNKLFCTFERLELETQHEGTGIGLATVKKIIQRHGGSVWADGVLNQGATFYFTLDNKFSVPVREVELAQVN